jgi:electron transport complex protein RnfC
MSQAIKLWDIHGGIHPAENKEQSSHQPIRQAKLPKKLYLPLQQHIGSPSELCVEVGDKVLKGQRLADANGFISASLHAPTSGTVIGIEERAIPHPSGLSSETLIIETDGEETWCEREIIEDYRHTDPALLLDHIRNHGITGMGGAGFPTSVKLTPKDDDHIHTLIINGAECEPYITADHLLMRERADQVIEGIGVLGHILKPRRCIIGVEDNKMDAVEALKTSIAAHPNTLPFEVVVAAIPTKYPSGGEKQLIQILTGKEVPHGGIPADLGIVCQNVGTVAAVAKAVFEGEPLISRITTVTGNAVADKGNFETLIGTPIADLLYQCALDDEDLHRLIMGGPMMGFALQSTDLPIIKTTNCILAATEAEFPNPAQAQDCIRCGMCAEACPAELLPQQLYWFSRSKEFDKAKHFNLFDCIECGACSFECPSHIPLVQYFRFAKGSIRAEEQAHIKSDRAKMRFEARQERLAKEEAEKEARRKARAEAAAKAKAEKEAAAKQAEENQTESKQTQSTEDDKKAAIAAAVARAKSKKGEESSAPAADLKALKVASSQARAAYLKAQRTLDAAKEAGELSPEQVSEQEAEVSKLQKAYETAKANMDAARSGSSAPTKANAKTSKAETSESPAIDVKALKVASSQARAAYLKAQRALDASKESGELSPDQVSEHESEVAKLQATYEAAKKALDDAKSGNASPAPSEKAAAKDKPASQTLDQKYKEMKVKASQARAAAKQAQKAVDQAKEEGQTDEQLKTLEIALAEAVKAYEKVNAKKLVLQEKVKLQKEAPAKPAVEAISTPKPAESTTDDDPAMKVKELKVAASQAKAAWRKLERELTAAQEAGEDVSALETQVSEAKAKYDQANEAKTAAMDALKG